ncbi:IgaA/UmoB family intracellular growth attenuator [Enterobacter chengduensis]
MMRETTRAAQALNSPAPGGFVIVSDEGSDQVIQRFSTHRTQQHVDAV